MNQSFHNWIQLNSIQDQKFCGDLTHTEVQRYKVLFDADVQVCRVPRRKNIIDKIRFRCFDRWQDYHFSLEPTQIISTTVGFFYNYFF